MNLYRIKHVPSGLYYKPGTPNLTKKGKVYTGATNVLNYFKNERFIPIRFSEKAYNECGKHYHQYCRDHDRQWWQVTKVPREDFIIEPVNA